MKILTINFGHDASLGIFDMGGLRDFVEIERESRLKHHFGLSTEVIESYLARVGYSFAEIDLVVLSGTQQWGMFHDQRVKVTFGYVEGLHDSVGITREAHWDQQYFQLYQQYAEDSYREHVRRQNLKSSPSPARITWAHNFARDFSGRFTDISALANTGLQLEARKKKEYWSNFLPYSFSLDGVEKPAFF